MIAEEADEVLASLALLLFFCGSMDLGDLETTVKVIVVGNGGVGKSSMTARYCRGVFTSCVFPVGDHRLPAFEHPTPTPAHPRGCPAPQNVQENNWR